MAIMAVMAFCLLQYFDFQLEIPTAQAFELSSQQKKKKKRNIPIRFTF